MDTLNTVDLLALPVSEAALHALQELGRGPVSAEFARALELALSGADVWLAHDDAQGATRFLAALAIELSDAGTVLVVADTGRAAALRDALVRVARHADRPVADDGAIRVIDIAAVPDPSLEGVVAVLGLAGDHTPAVAALAEAAGIHPVVWAHAPELSAPAAESLVLVTLPEGTSAADATLRLILSRTSEGGVLVVAPDAEVVQAIASALDTAEVDSLVLDASATSPRRHALATRARRGEVEALIATDAALREIDGRGFSAVVCVTPPRNEAWVRRAARARQLLVIAPAEDAAFWAASAARAGRVLVDADLPDAEAASGRRLVRATRAVAGHADTSPDWHASRVQALLTEPGGLGVLAAALRVLLRHERQHAVAVAALSDHHAPASDLASSRSIPRPKAEAAAPKPADAVGAAADGPRKKRRRRRRRTPGGDPGAATTDGTPLDDEDGDEDDGPVEIDLTDLDAMLEVE